MSSPNLSEISVFLRNLEAPCQLNKDIFFEIELDIKKLFLFTEKA